MPTTSRRNFMRSAGLLAGAVAASGVHIGTAPKRRPNVVFVFADQWRAQATGYSGDRNVRTPNLDELAGQSINLTNAVSTCPVCSPYRGSLITGRYPLTHGVFLNDVCLNHDAVSLADSFHSAGYRTGYIGKWHLDGHGRSSFIPKERRQGFEFWKVLECTHDYNRSAYYGDEPVKQQWPGYDAIAQTAEAEKYIRDNRADPFLLVLSWGPPHNPYQTAPQNYRAMYDPQKLQLRPNVPKEAEAEARRDLAGYYAHCSALDDCIGSLMRTIREAGIEDDTLFIFTSDHGDMLGSHGEIRKQRPYDESIRVPFLIHHRPLGQRSIDTPIGTPDIMPTLLGLCGIDIPRTVEGLDFSSHLKGGPSPGDGAALVACYTPFGEWTRGKGGREYRGIRSARYTYVRELKAPWLLFDNAEDPYQMKNLISSAAHQQVRADLDALLQRKLIAMHDDFRPGDQYIRKWGYRTDASGTVPYTN